MLGNILRSKILKNTLYTLGGKISAMVLYMAFDIACARMLNPEDYAEWVFFFATLTMMFYLGWCGVNRSAKVFVSKESTKQDISDVIQAAFVLRLAVSMVIAVLITCMAYPLSSWLGYPDKYPNLFHLCCIAGVLVFLNSFTELYKELYMGMGTFKRLCGITVVEYAGYFLFSIAFLFFYKKPEAIAAGYFCAGLLVSGVGIISLRNITGNKILPLISGNYKSIMCPIMKYAIPIAVCSIGGMILVEMDTFMLGILSSKLQVANYGIAKNLCAKATHINYALTVGCMTFFSVLTAKNIREKRIKLMKISGVNILIALTVSGFFYYIGTFIVTAMYGMEYSASGTILKYLVPYYVLYSISNFFATFLDFQGRAKMRSICYCTVIVLNFGLNLLFIPKYGAIGAAVATSLSLLPYTLLVVIIAVRVFRNIQIEREQCD